MTVGDTLHSLWHSPTTRSLREYRFDLGHELDGGNPPDKFCRISSGTESRSKPSLISRSCVRISLPPHFFFFDNDKSRRQGTGNETDRYFRQISSQITSFPVRIQKKKRKESSYKRPEVITQTGMNTTGSEKST